MRGGIRRVLAFASCAIGITLLTCAPVHAQGSGNASIVGTVTDESGAVLPGVTVEASSPALIEKVRSTVSDSQGRYQIIELRPGTYTVTVSLPGFSTFQRTGIQLTTNFTATINAQLKVGQVEEVVSVTAATPLVDTRTLTQQRTISQETLSAVPTSQSALGIASLMPSVVQPPNAQDVGGTKGEQSVRISVHGTKTSDARLRQEGMIYNALTPGTNYGTAGLEGTGRGYYVDPHASQEIIVDTGTMGSAEYGVGGAQSNSVYKDGGNRFSGTLFGAWTGHQLQSDNLTSELQAQGLDHVNGVRKVYDGDAVLGGPVMQDRLWFLAHIRRWGNSGRPADSVCRRQPRQPHGGGARQPVAVRQRPQPSDRSAGSGPGAGRPVLGQALRERQGHFLLRSPAQLPGLAERCALPRHGEAGGQRVGPPEPLGLPGHVDPAAVQPRPVRSRVDGQPVQLRQLRQQPQFQRLRAVRPGVAGQRVHQRHRLRLHATTAAATGT